MTQLDTLLELTAKGWTSPLDLFLECGSMRFSGRLFDARQQGYEFEERICSQTGKLGREVSWKEVRLKRKEEIQGELL